MRRFYFQFVFAGGREVVAFTTDLAKAEKLRKHSWTTGASTYLTPELTRVDDAGEPLEGYAYRANLVHVEDIVTWTVTL